MNDNPENADRPDQPGGLNPPGADPDAWVPPPPPAWGPSEPPRQPWRDPTSPGPASGENPYDRQPPAYGSYQPPPGGGWGPPPGYGYGGGYGGGYPPYPPGWDGGRPGGWAYGWSQRRARRTLPGTVTALLLAVAVLVGLGIGHGVWRSVRNSTAIAPGGTGNSSPFGNGSGGAFNPFGGSSGTGNSGGGSATPLSPAVTAAADGLVDIDTDLSYQNGAAAGTGIVLTSNGVVLTNNHVISGATSIKATDIANGRTYTATVVGYDRTHDVAIIQLQGASGLRTAALGDSSKVSVGESVVGLGNAGGVGGTPSSAAGQVTALGQSITAQDEGNGTSERLTGLIQTNANIQPGDSGGALVDSSGKVVGMDTAASTGFSFSSPGNQGFAIPINQAIAIGGQIRAGKASTTVHIGPTAFLGVEVDTSQAAAGVSGAVITSAISGGPAASAGLGQGDVITSVGGTSISSPATLTQAISKYHPGDSVTVGYQDASGATHQVQVTLANGPAQ